MSDVTECSGCGEPITAAGCPWCRTNYETASLKAQLAAVEKERDEARNGPIYVMYCNAMHARRKAEEERDKATGALAAAMAMVRKHLDDSACDGDLCAYEWHEDARRLLGSESPAADLAARHDAEVERRALEKVLALPSYGPDGFPTKGHLRTFISIADIQALATPTPEKPR